MKKFFERMMLRKMNEMMGRYETLNPVMKGMIAFFMHTWPGQISCREFDAFLSDYIDGSLPDRIASRVRFHIKVCPMCRRHHNDLAVTVGLTRGLEDEACTPNVSQEVINAVLVALASDPNNNSS